MSYSESLRYMSELDEFVPGQVYASEVAEFHRQLGASAAVGFARTANGLVVTAGHLNGSSDKPVWMAGGTVGEDTDYVLKFDFPLLIRPESVAVEVEFPDVAVTPRLACAPHFPMGGLVHVIDIPVLAALSDRLDAVTFDPDFSSQIAGSIGGRIEETFRRFFVADPTIAHFGKPVS